MKQEKRRGRVYNRTFNKEDWAKVNKLNKRLLDDFLLELKMQKKSQGTINQYKNDLRIVLLKILKDYDNKSILEMNKKEFKFLLFSFSEDNSLSSARCNRIKSATSSMLNFAEEDEDYDYEMNCVQKIKGLPKESVREIQFLTDEQILKLRNELIKRKKYLHAVYLDLSYDSGARRNECYQVLKEGLLEKNNTNIVVGKRNKKFPLIYFDRTKESLKLYLDERGEDDIPNLFVKVDNKGNKTILKYGTLYSYILEMANILEEIEGKYIPFNPHSLRHSTIENLSTGDHYICKKLNKENGFSLEELKVFAHHESTDTTSSYMKNKDDDILQGMFGIKIG